MNKNDKRLLLFVTSCGIAGLIVGGVSVWIENNRCNDTAKITQQCLTENATTKTVRGMATGLAAGVGAALAIALKIHPKE